MTKYQLALELRQRLICRGDLSKSQAAQLSANQVLAIHYCCPDCSLPYITPEQLATATEKACCAELWLQLIAEFKHANDLAQDQPLLLTPPEKEHGH